MRDVNGVIQCNLDPEIWSKLNDIPKESVIGLRGKVIERPEGQINPEMETGDVELEVEDLIFANPASSKLPFRVRDAEQTNDLVTSTHRFLALRNDRIHKKLVVRSKMVNKMRTFLVDNDFVDVETPILFRRTPGGAQEFVVPTRLA